MLPRLRIAVPAAKIDDDRQQQEQQSQQQQENVRPVEPRSLPAQGLERLVPSHARVAIEGGHPEHVFREHRVIVEAAVLEVDPIRRCDCSD